MYDYITVSPFPGCCTAWVVSDLNCLNSARGKSAESAEREFVSMLNKYCQHMITATTTNYQKDAAKILRKYGFKRTTYKSKPLGFHPETKLALWWRAPDVKARSRQYTVKK